jgi:3-dehydroquinate dehydratase-2
MPERGAGMPREGAGGGERERRLLVLSGPNLNLLGTREPGVYGSVTLEEIHRRVTARGEAFGVGVETDQVNGEGELIGRVHRALGRVGGIVLNAGAYTHTSYALRDAISAVALPVVEVHMSNTAARERFRHRSVIAAVCWGTVAGFGALSYELAVEALVRRLWPDPDGGSGSYRKP